METKASVRGVRLSADKGRLVADMIRGKKVDQALNILTLHAQEGGRHRLKALGRPSPMPNTTTAPTSTNSKVKSIYVEQGRHADALLRARQRAAATASASPPATST